MGPGPVSRRPVLRLRVVRSDLSRYDEIRNKITPFLKSLGFNPKTDLTFIPVSAQMGHNMKEPLDKSIASWYTGPTLIDFMDNMEIMDRDVNAPFMFPVSEKYNEMGTMVMGKIESGRVKKGDTLLCMPNKVSYSWSDREHEEEEFADHLPRQQSKSVVYTPRRTTRWTLRSVETIFESDCVVFRTKTSCLDSSSHRPASQSRQ